MSIKRKRKESNGGCLGNLVFYGVGIAFLFNMCTSDNTKVQVTTKINEVKTEVAEGMSPELKDKIAKLSKDAAEVGKQIVKELEENSDKKEPVTNTEEVADVGEKIINVDEVATTEDLKEAEEIEQVAIEEEKVEPVDYGGMVLTPKL